MAPPRTRSRPSGSDSRPPPAPRERILLTASRLFARRGAARTGVDLVIAEAGVAKATFYRHFPSKEDLIVAWLRAPGTRWFSEIRPVVEADSPTPQIRLARLFDAVARWLETGEYTGCPYLNLAVEAPDPGQPAALAAREYLDEIRAYLEAIAAEAGHPDPATAGRQLQAMLGGSITLGVAQQTTAFVVAAGDVAQAVLRH